MTALDSDRALSVSLVVYSPHSTFLSSEGMVSLRPYSNCGVGAGLGIKYLLRTSFSSSVIPGCNIR